MVEMIREAGWEGFMALWEKFQEAVASSAHTHKYSLKYLTLTAQKIVLNKSSKANRNGKKKVQAHVYQEKLAHSHPNVKLLTNVYNFFPVLVCN